MDLPWGPCILKPRYETGVGLFLDLARDLLEHFGVSGGEFGKHLAVQGYAGFFEAAHELAVRDLEVFRSRADASLPQPAEIALLELAAAVSVFARVPDRFIGRPEIGFPVADETLGSADNFLSSSPFLDSSFDACHG